MKHITRKTPAVSLAFLLGIFGVLTLPCVAADTPPPTVRAPALRQAAGDRRRDFTG